MDPNACFERIMSSLADQDVDGFTEAFADLRDWLVRGGFPPTVRSLGIGRYTVGPMKTEDRPRRVLSAAPFGVNCKIQCIAEQVDQKTPDRFEFVVCRGSDRKVFPLA